MLHRSRVKINLNNFQSNPTETQDGEAKPMKSNGVTIETSTTVIIEVPQEEKIVRRGSLRFRGILRISVIM